MIRKDLYLPIEPEDYYQQMSRLYNKNIVEITFQITEDCCLNCSYCYQHHKTHHAMNFDTAKEFIDKLITNQYDFITTEFVDGVVLSFIGGEPLLESDLMYQITEYYFLRMTELKHPWACYSRVNVCTNGVLYFNEKFQKFLKDFMDVIGYGTSVDGNKTLHDSCRVDYNGNGSYDKTIAAMRDYERISNQKVLTKMTLSPENLPFLYDSIQNFIEEDFLWVHLNCVFENVWTIKDAQLLYKQLKDAADYLIDNDYYNKIYLSIFDEDLGQPTTNENNWCGGVVSSSCFGCCAVDYKGDLYKCIRYMESSLNGKQPPLILGTVTNGINYNDITLNNYNLLSNITRESQSPIQCIECPVSEGCSWCSGFNYEEFGTPDKRTTYTCDMHKARVLANIYYWNKLYKKLNITSIKNIPLSKEECLKYMSTQDYEILINISKKGE